MDANTTAKTVETAAEPSLWQNPEVWIAVAFTIFLALFLRYLLPMLTKALDKRSAEIKDQLEQASRLRQAAEELLASYQQQREEKAREAEALVTAAKAEAEALRARASAELNEALERRSQQAVDKIRRAEEQATQEIRTQMVEIATQAVAEIVRTQLASGNEDPAVARALRAIESQIH